jgi:oxygen-dependent protoporphyrinogen oxidase
MHARVVGAGVSGLAAALHLSDAGFEVDVFDAADRVGGLVATRTTAHGIVERAANGFTWTPATARVFERLGLTPEFASTVSRRRFIFRGGRPRRWPLTPVETAAFAARRARAWMSGRLAPEPGETVSQWSHRLHGAAATRWLVSPAMQGVYAAPADVLSASIIFGQPRRRARTAAPAGGMETFAVALRGYLESRGVRFVLGRECATLDAGVPTIVCTGAPAAARLIAPHAPGLATAIEGVGRTYLISVTAFFPPTAGDVHGFGVLFPRGCGVEAYGVLLGADVFASRHGLRSETWIYGSRDRDALVQPVERAIEQVLRDRRMLTGRDATPLGAYFGAGAGDRSDPGRAGAACAELPLYDEAIGHVRARLGDLPPWLGLAGNYLGQLGISRLLDVAERAAARMQDLRRVHPPALE